MALRLNVGVQACQSEATDSEQQVKTLATRYSRHVHATLRCSKQGFISLLFFLLLGLKRSKNVE